MAKKIAFACDHGGYELKDTILKYLSDNNYETVDFGCMGPESVDYPDYAVPASKAVASGDCELGILVCGTGIGMSLCANKVNGIRAACCSDTFSAKMTRAHNNANVLCIGQRVVGPGLALEIIREFLETEFEGERHLRRINKVMAIEKLN